MRSSEFDTPAEVIESNEQKLNDIFMAYQERGAFDDSESMAFYSALKHPNLARDRAEIIGILLQSGEPTIFCLVRDARNIASKTLYEIYFARLSALLRKSRNERESLRAVLVDPEARKKIIDALSKLPKD